MLLKPLAAILLLAAVTGAHAVTASDSYAEGPENVFYRSGSQGWYWYAEPEPSPQEAEEAEPEPVQQAASETSEKTADVPPEPFSLKWVQTMLPRYRETAWDDPTPENVQAYFLVQRFAIDRAAAFADAAHKAVAGNALLDPAAAQGANQAQQAEALRVAAEKSEALLKKISEKAGICFFFRSDCRFCEIEAPLIASFEKKGFSILAVSVDGGRLQSQSFEFTRKDEGQAALLGVKATPAVYLMTEQGRMIELGQTLLSFPELRERIFTAALQERIITPEELSETKPAKTAEGRDFSRELPLLMKAASENPALLFGNKDESDRVASMPGEEKAALADADNFIPPKKIISLLGISNKPSAETVPGDVNENQ